MSDTKQDEFLGLARKRFSAAAEDEKHLREMFISDLKFASPDGNDQWDPTVKAQRLAAGRPAMSFPRCHTFVQQVSNEARRRKPSIKFSPRLDQDKDTAEVLEGLARYIQYDSQAQVAYETAIEYSAGGSFGYYRFLTDYVNDAQYDELPEDEHPRDLKVVPVLDPTAIYGILVPACFNRVPKYAFVVEDIPKEEYKQLYGESQMASLSWAEAEQRSDGWVSEHTVRIAEYWYVEETKGKRKPKSVVKFCKTNGFEVLADTETTWPGSTIPIIPVLGKQMILEGKPRLFSVVSPQKAPQQLINYSKSRIAETLSTAPVSPFMVVEGQIAGYEAQWQALNKTVTPYLQYKAVDVAGRPAPPPQRQVYEPPIQALSSFVLQEVDDMKATTGIYDAALGNQANETSGKAILARKDQSNLTTMHYIDNLGRSFKQAGDIIAEVVPIIYDTERQIEILGEDETQKVVTINKEHKDHNGKTVHYKVKDAKMSYVVTMAQAFDTKRMESFDTIQQVLQANPELINIIGDVFFRNSDLAGADQIAERMKKMLPPNLQDEDDQQPIPPQAQAQIQQLSQHLQAVNAAAQEYEKEIGKLQFEQKAKVIEHQGRMQEIAAKAQADMALEDKKLLAQITIAEIGTKAQIVSDREADRRALEAQFHDQAHDVAMATVGHQQAQELQAQQADTQSQQMDQQHQQGLEAQVAAAEGTE